MGHEIMHLKPEAEGIAATYITVYFVNNWE